MRSASRRPGAMERESPNSPEQAALQPVAMTLAKGTEKTEPRQAPARSKEQAKVRPTADPKVGLTAMAMANSQDLPPIRRVSTPPLPEERQVKQTAAPVSSR